MDEKNENLLNQSKKVKGEDIDKTRLREILKSFEKKLSQENSKTISDVYLIYSEEQLSKFRVKQNNNKSTLNKLCYKFLLFLITMIYLIGSFIIISIKKSFWNLFVVSLKCKFDIYCDKEDFRKKANFFEYFLDQLLREPIDLNLILFWNFLGINLSNSFGFSLTSIIFLILNVLFLLMTYNISYDHFDPKICKYSYPKLLLLLTNWTGFTITLGASSLLAQQKLIDYYNKLEEKENNSEQEKKVEYIELKEDVNNNIINDDITDNEEAEEINDKSQKEIIKEKIELDEKEERKKKFTSLALFSLANFFGYMGKYGIGIGFTYYKQNYISSINKTLNNNTNNENVINILNNYQVNNDTDIPITDNIDINSEITELNQNIFVYIGIIYIACVLLSVFIYFILIYCFFEKKAKKEEKEENKEKACCQCCSCCCTNCCEYCKCCNCCNCNCCFCNIILGLSGYIFYLERGILLEDKELIREKEKRIGCCQLCCETINHYCNDVFCFMCNCCNKTENDCCFYKYNEDIFDKDAECFCYCYQEKSVFYWVNKFFINETQKEIVICMFLYFFSKLSIIGCQEKYENVIKEYDILEEMWPFLISLLICFVSFTLITSIINCHKRRIKKIQRKERNCCDNLLYKLNNTFSWVIIILIVNIFLGFIYSYFILFKEFNERYLQFFIYEKSLVERLNLYSTIMMNVFIVFLLNHYCLIITRKKIDIEKIISQSITITIYFIIVDSLIALLKLLLNDIYNFFYIQLIVTILFILVLIIIFLIIIIRVIFLKIFNCSNFCSYQKGKCHCLLCCCKKNDKCYSKYCFINCSSCDCDFICCEPCYSEFRNLLK